MNTRFFHLRARHLPVFFVTAMAFGAFSSTQSRVYAQETDAPAPPTKAPEPPQVGEIAPDFELEAIDGTKVKLSAQTDKGPVVLVELRGYPGYQCPICTAQVGQLINKAEEFNKAKAQVVLVYPGPAEGLKAHADEFVRGKNLPTNFYLLLDPDFAVTKQYGLRWEAKNETSYPSTFVLDGERKVLFAKVSHSHGGRATVEEILAALPK
ncbi:hypothetical protein IAD21_03877 [Abditibacteriota bacterium]|nr:hypothetical protein IAD21_03877 [Abditibacteriota bacterium]